MFITGVMQAHCQNSVLCVISMLSTKSKNHSPKRDIKNYVRAQILGGLLDGK